MSATKSKARCISSVAEHILPDGRQVVLSWEGEAGEITVHAPDGELEVTVRITDSGPVLELTGARVELKASDEVSIQSRILNLSATEKASVTSGDGLEIRSSGHTELTAEGEVRVLGSMIHLN